MLSAQAQGVNNKSVFDCLRSAVNKTFLTRGALSGAVVVVKVPVFRLTEEIGDGKFHRV